LEKWRAELKIRNLITLTMIIVGIVLIVLGVFAITYHHPYYVIPDAPILLVKGQEIKPTLAGYVYPYASVGLILGILGLVMLIIGPLLSSIKLEK
jgi:hypothetical protein